MASRRDDDALAQLCLAPLWPGTLPGKCCVLTFPFSARMFRHCLMKDARSSLQVRQALEPPGCLQMQVYASACDLIGCSFNMFGEMLGNLSGSRGGAAWNGMVQRKGTVSCTIAVHRASGPEFAVWLDLGPWSMLNQTVDRNCLPAPNISPLKEPAIPANRPG